MVAQTRALAGYNGLNDKRTATVFSSMQIKRLGLVVFNATLFTLMFIDILFKVY